MLKVSTLNDNRRHTVTEEGKGLGERVMWINVLAFEPLKYFKLHAKVQ